MPPAAPVAWGAAPPRPPHVPTGSCCSAESLAARTPERMTQALAAGQALAREVEDVIGDGVMLHPPHPRVAPKHGRTVGRPWVITADGRVQPARPAHHRRCRSASTRDGLPLGVQVVAGMDRDHVVDRGRARARARLRRLDAAAVSDWLTAMRRSYDPGHLDVADLEDTWLTQMEAWIAEAVGHKLPEPNAMALATAAADARPSARTVLLKGLDERGLCSSPT